MHDLICPLYEMLFYLCFPHVACVICLTIHRIIFARLLLELCSTLILDMTKPAKPYSSTVTAFVCHIVCKFLMKRILLLRLG